ADLGGALRDLVAWARILAGPLEVENSRADAGSASALLLAARTPVLVRVAVGSVPRPFLRVTALGETGVDVVIDELGGRSAITVAASSGSRVLPRRFETPERLTLRAAVADLVGSADPSDSADPSAPAVPTDLEDLLSDVRIAERILGGRQPAP
ncbi:MAG TPA: hypothetical protein VIL55_13215, partial [Naasia sp.]